MPRFLEEKLKEEYGANSDIPYKIMNAQGYMHGNKETEKGREAEAKHSVDMGTFRKRRKFMRRHGPGR